MLQQPPTKSLAQPVTVLAAGDVMLVLGMVPLLRRHGAEYPFREVRPLLSRADVVIANLEAPFTTRNTPTPHKSAKSVKARRDYILRAHPDTAKGLTFAGITAVSLANNHTMDYQRGGLEDTLAILDRLGIAHAGAGRNIVEARRPAVLERKGLRLALLSYSCILPVGSVATATRGGIAPARGFDAEKAMQADIARARRESHFVIVSVHWGDQLARYPNQMQKRLGRLFLEWGADAVIGHHPHVLQGVELHNGRLIAYSLGDFVNLSSRHETAILQIVIDRPHHIDSANLIPLELRLGQPRQADGKTWRQIVRQMRVLSSAWGTRIDEFGGIWLTSTSAG
jgi:poly-gamma-glutamate synthesis protein (capsule biosynthesis protein)